MSLTQERVGTSMNDEAMPMGVAMPSRRGGEVIDASKRTRHGHAATEASSVEARHVSEHHPVGLPTFLVYSGITTSLDLLISAGISRATTGPKGDSGFIVFMGVFIGLAVIALVFSDSILQRITRAPQR